MQGRREQLARRPSPEATGTSLGTTVRVLLAVVLLAGTSALEPEPTSSVETVNATDVPKPQCECIDESSLVCSFLSLKNITEELNPCPTYISKLDVSHNQLESLDGVNVWFGSELNASHNHISEIHSNSFKNDMKVVDVSWNDVTLLDVEHLWTLRVLNASHNILENVTALPRSCDLEVLDLSSNLLEQIPEGIKECGKLEVLDASNNTVREFPDGLFEEFLDEDAIDAKTLLVDLRGNELAPNDESLRALVDSVKLIFSADNCPCANLTRGHAVLILCLSVMCTNDTEYWTSVNGSSIFDPKHFSFPNTSVVLQQNEGDCEGDCDVATVSSVFSSTSKVDVSIDLITDTINSTGIVITVSPMTTTITQESEHPQKPHVPENAPRSGRADQTPKGSMPHLPTANPPPPHTDNPTPTPDREGRKKGRLWVTLALTVVVLVAAGVGVYVLVKLYRRRRRQILEERSQRLPLQPLIATPLSLRARDDHFVP